MEVEGGGGGGGGDGGGGTPRVRRSSRSSGHTTNSPERDGGGRIRGGVGGCVGGEASESKGEDMGAWEAADAEANKGVNE